MPKPFDVEIIVSPEKQKPIVSRAPDIKSTTGATAFATDGIGEL